MTKKRNCEQTEQERMIHKRAVALRKMTDEQLMKYMDQQYKVGYENGQQAAEILKTISPGHKEVVLAAIAKLKGIGAATMARIRTAIEGL